MPTPGQAPDPVSRVLVRRDLLRTAVELARPIEECVGADAVLEIADELYGWVFRPMAIKPLSFGPILDRATGAVNDPRYSSSAFTYQGDHQMSNLQLGDSQQVNAFTQPLDADNQPTTDTLVWSASAPAAVGLTPSADTLSCVIAGLVPTTGVAITATDSLGNTTSGDVDVVAGQPASLSLQFGPVTDRTPDTGDTGSTTPPASGDSGDGSGTAAPTTPDAGTASA